MSPSNPVLDLHLQEEGPFRTYLLPILLGLAVDLGALAIGDPYRMASLGAASALVATLAWSRRPVAWVIFVAVLAGNPANPTTPIALNLYCAGVFLLMMRAIGWRSLPRPLQVAFAFALLSLAVSLLASLGNRPVVPTIHTTEVPLPRSYNITWTGGPNIDNLLTQTLAFINFLLGPFLLIPLVFSRIRGDHDSGWLLNGLLLGLVAPTLLLFLTARLVGRAHLDANALATGLLNVSTYKLGKLDIQMIRTQSGIILAALTTASFAVAISPVRRGTRAVALACLAAAAYLVLVTGSVGSSLAALGGMAMVLALGKRQFSINRYAGMLVVGAGLAVAAWTVLPRSVQAYTTARYELRIGGGESPVADRAWRWRRSLEFLSEHPSGVGWSLYIESLGTYPHNDYISYAIAYGALCGILYLLLPSGLLFSFFALNPKALDPPRFALSLAGAGVATVVLVNSLSDHLTANRWYFNVVWSLVWYAFFAARASGGWEPGLATQGRPRGRG